MADSPKIGPNRRRASGNAGKGRPKGSLNKVTADVKALAGKHGPVAIRELARLAQKAESEAARVAAIKELLDRAYGKPTQPLAGDKDNPLIPPPATPSVDALAKLTKDERAQLLDILRAAAARS